MTIAEIIEREPEVGRLLDLAGRDASGSAEPDWELYEEYKAQLRQLVGYCAKRDDLCSEEVYRIALNALCDELQI